jgi:hypothetical protein
MLLEDVLYCTLKGITMIVIRSVVLCVCFVDLYLSFCPFSFSNYVVCPSLNYGFWLPLLNLKPLLKKVEFQDGFGSKGTRDDSPYCTVPEAIKFYNAIGGYVCHVILKIYIANSTFLSSGLRYKSGNQNL